MDNLQLTKLSHALLFLARKLEFGERLTLDRYGRSVTWDAAAKALPFRVRSMVDSPDDRAGFAARVIESAGPRSELGDGILWMQPGERLHFNRLEVVQIKMELILPARDPAEAETSIPWLEISRTRLYVALGLLANRVRGEASR